MAKSVRAALALLLLATRALSECTGIHTFGTCADGIVHWYDPNTGEICDPLDCGGGRAAPRTDVPGCPLYKGTLVRATTPSYMPCFSRPTSTAPASPPAETTTSASSAVLTNASSPSASSSSSSAPATAGSNSAGSSSGVGSTITGGASSAAGTGSSALTTAPPASTTPSTSSSTSSTGGSSSSSSTSAPSSAGGNMVGGSWVAAVAGVALGAVAVI